ncbi:hypothetical protein HU200_013564 [Digitaria exilis]|uniref:Uncharacterized protein n=1 Tax=Digitaria exilis TaxID=1010633 RepID=A0A835FE11_9POAL|nr:hypothetical protein HU200_013564 [Digitaria exilis]
MAPVGLNPSAAASPIVPPFLSSQRGPPSPYGEYGKPTRVTQSMHPYNVARAYYKCGDHRCRAQLGANYHGAMLNHLDANGYVTGPRLGANFHGPYA